jgi:hypothetical protein
MNAWNCLILAAMSDLAVSATSGKSHSDYTCFTHRTIDRLLAAALHPDDSVRLIEQAAQGMT